MNVITMREYARQKNISYEAVRKQVVRYKDELEGHIIQDGRQQFLDEEAVAFLDAKRQKNPVAILHQDKDEQIEQLEEQVKQLLITTAAQANRIAELSEWKANNAQLIASADQIRLALEASEKDKKLLESFIQDAKAEIRTLTDEKIEAAAVARKEIEEAHEKEQQAVQETQRVREELLDKEKAVEEEKRLREASEAELQAYMALPWYKRMFR